MHLGDQTIYFYFHNVCNSIFFKMKTKNNTMQHKLVDFSNEKKKVTKLGQIFRLNLGQNIMYSISHNRGFLNKEKEGETKKRKSRKD